MTKQEQIEEMAVMVCCREPKAKTIEECRYCTFKGGACIEYDLAEALYNAGYRQEKEVAKEIFNKLFALIKYDGHTISVWKNDLQQLAKEYGIEVEE